jgi:hypothetical protein
MNTYGKHIFMALLLVAGLFSCNQPAGYSKPDDGLDAGREFIRAVLDGDYEKAQLYIPREEDDRLFFDRYKSYMRQRPAAELTGLKASSIIVNKVEPTGDTLVLINYANSFSKKPMDVKVVRRNGEWWVDFKYTFSGNLPAN